MFTFAAIETLLQDLRYGLRVLLKNPGFSVAAVATMALGIGVNVAIFSLVYGVLLRPLPYASGDRLVVLHQQASRANVSDVPFSVKEIEDYRHGNHTLDSVVEHHSMNFLLLTGDGAERVDTAVVSANFFDVLGVKPLLGRTFVASDEQHGSDAVLILSHEYWSKRHGGDPKIVGKVFQMNNRPHTVIGVLPPIPQYPVSNDVYMPTSQCPTRSSEQFIANRTARMMTAFGRLKPGVTVEQAQADLSVVAGQLIESYPDAYRPEYGYGIATAPLLKDLTRRAESTFLVLLGTAGLILLIACANVANLMLARLLKVERELALRYAIGASRLRIARQLLTESVLLSLVGGLAGVALAPAALRLLTQFAERFTTRAPEVQLDAPVLLFALGLSVASGVLFGVWPALSSGRDVAESIKQSNGRTSDSPLRQWLRSSLVVTQVAVSFVLLIGAGLTIRSLQKLQKVDAGFRADHLLTMRVSPNFTRYTNPAQYREMTERLIQDVRAITGVASVALASNFPFNPAGMASGPTSTTFAIEGRTLAAGAPAQIVDSAVVTPDYFSTIGLTPVAGRLLSDHDHETAPRVAVISAAMAGHRWPGENAVGKRISFDRGTNWIEVVGIVKDVHEYGLDRPANDKVYRPFKQAGGLSSLLVRTSGDPTALYPAVREALRRVDPQIAVDRVFSEEALIQESVASPRTTTMLLALFGGLALLISSSGIGATMALTVSQRTNELGIRMALGAQRSELVGSVVRRGMALALAGSALGTAGALILTRLASSLLFETSPTDFTTFAAVTVLFLSIAAVACLLPARQITRIDPLIALRQE